MNILVIFLTVLGIAYLLRLQRKRRRSRKRNKNIADYLLEKNVYDRPAKPRTRPEQRPIHPAELSYSAFKSKLENWTVAEARDYWTWCNEHDVALNEKYPLLAEKIGAEQETQLLDTIEQLQPGQLERWFEKEKDRGTFFTARVYGRLQAKMDGERV